MLLTFVVGLLLYATVIGKFILSALVVWWIVDAFLLSKIVKTENKRLAKSLSH